MDSLDNNKAAQPNDNPIKAVQIPSTELKDLMYPKTTDRRGKSPHIVKKTLREVIDVACKSVTIPDEEEKPHEYQKAQALFTILGKLRESDNIIKFYGLSTIDKATVIVLEWAELGSLREVYEKYDIGWRAKVEIALEICRGLTFLHSCEILHHDIRCDNIMMDKNYKPKIANFDYARHIHGETTFINNVTEIVHWLAPEKLKHGQEQPYNFKCEIFSFGMLLWELAFEIIPYGKWDMIKIKEHVLAGGRENIQFSDEVDGETKNLQQDYAEIIRGAWETDPLLRSLLQGIFFQLNRLYSKYPPPVAGPRLHQSKTIDFDGSLRGGKKPVSISEEGMQFNESLKSDAIMQIMSLDEGIKAHKAKDHKTAWSCFQEHATLNNPRAKYWKGYYLWEGYCGYKRKEIAAQLYKEAADGSVADAQLRYAFSMIENKTFNKEEFIRYLELAAYNSNPTAQFSLGDVYINGKLGIAKDEVKGIEYLKLAALNKHPKANEVLKGMNIDIYI